VRQSITCFRNSRQCSRRRAQQSTGVWIFVPPCATFVTRQPPPNGVTGRATAHGVILDEPIAASDVDERRISEQPMVVQVPLAISRRLGPLSGELRSWSSANGGREVWPAPTSGFFGACVKTHRPRFVEEQIPTAANSAQERRLTRSSDLTSTSLDTTLLHSNKFGFERESLAVAAGRARPSRYL
jgi:hypothetical protein